MIEDLTDLLAEDWVKLGAIREMGADTERFFGQEMEKTWGGGGANTWLCSQKRRHTSGYLV